METKDISKIKNVGLIYLGKSREQHSDSAETIENIRNSILKLGFNCILYQQSDPSFAKKFILDMPDFAFNYVPGDYGEDGRLSGFFEVVGIPYSHPGLFHHCVSINKSTAKILFKANEIDIPMGKIVTRNEILKNLPLLEYPYVIKPIDSGSSLNTLLIKDEKTYYFTENNCPFEEEALVEEFIPGKEFTVTVFKGKAIGIIEISSGRGFLDFEVKNSISGEFETNVKPDLSQELNCRISKTAEKAYTSVKANSIARVDLKYDEESDRVVVLEINTIPGMTPNSFVPLAFKEFLGLDFSEMIRMIIVDGLEYWNKSQELENSYRDKGYFQ